MIEIDRQDFEDWLDSNRDRHFVVGDAECCPLAEYLKETHGTKDVSVSADCVSIEDGYGDLDDWAADFITLFDELGNRGDRVAGPMAFDALRTALGKRGES